MWSEVSKKIIIFDLDDTLISEREYIDSGFKVIAEELSKKTNFSSEDIKKMMDDLFKLTPQKLINRILDKLQIDYAQEDIQALVQKYRNHTPTIKLYPDAEEILEHLSKEGYRLGIITDGYKETQKKKIEVLKIDKYFEHIIITDEIGKKFWKPNETSYKMMKEKFNTEFKNMIYIGDNPKKDFIAANRLGMETIQIKRTNGIYHKEKYKGLYRAKKKIKTLSQILNLLK